MRRYIIFLTIFAFTCSCRTQEKFQRDSKRSPSQSPSPTPGNQNQTNTGGGGGVLPPPDLKVALTGDTDTTPGGNELMKLVKSKGANALLIAGDLNYNKGANAETFEKQVNEYLGADFPVFVVRGNHDKPWTDKGHYQDRMKKRYDALQQKGDIKWSGDPGMKSTVQYKGLAIAAVAPSNGVSVEDSVAEIAKLASLPEAWRIAMWHENMPAFRGNAGCGEGKDLVGWEVFEKAREVGAFILNGHNHCYSRSKLLSCTGGSCSKEKNECKEGPELPVVASTSDPVGLMALDEGATYVLLSGMGGHQNGRISETGDWWAKQSGSACEAGGGSCEESDLGFVLCTFNPGGADPRKANCEFIDIKGKVTDKYTMTTAVGQ
ncbi:MAG: metallophosphoesterase [Oligoflexales bacterium]